jgi:hypothetical protein
MLSLHRTLDGDLTLGEPLPPVYRSLEEAEVRFFRSALQMSIGRPGGGKSIFALNHAVRVKVPTLYISADMSRFQVAARTAALVTGEPASSVKEIVKTVGGKEKYRAALRSVKHLYLAFDKRPDALVLEENIEAFTERWGCPPEYIVVDNVMNLLPQALDEWSGLREMSHVLDYFASELGAAVHGLHHINLGGQKLDMPAPLGGVKGQIVELQSLILSWAKVENEMRYTAVKNRDGPEDPMARSYRALALEPRSMVLSEPVRPSTAISGPYRGNSGG